MKCNEEDVLLINNRVYVDLTSNAVEILQSRKAGSHMQLKYNDHDYNVWSLEGTPCDFRVRFGFDPICYVLAKFDQSSKEKIVAIVDKWCQRVTAKGTVTCKIQVRNWVGTMGGAFTLTGDCTSCPRKFMMSVENTKVDKAIVLFSNTVYNINHSTIKQEPKME